MTGLPFHTGRYGCPVCPHRFTSLHDKKDHLRKQHPKKAPGIHGEGMGTGLPNDGDYADVELRALTYLNEVTK